MDGCWNMSEAIKIDKIKESIFFLRTRSRMKNGCLAITHSRFLGLQDDSLRIWVLYTDRLAGCTYLSMQHMFPTPNRKSFRMRKLKKKNNRTQLPMDGRRVIKCAWFKAIQRLITLQVSFLRLRGVFPVVALRTLTRLSTQEGTWL